MRCKEIIYFRIILRLHSTGQRGNFRQGFVRCAGPQHIEASPLGDMRRADFHGFSFLALVQEEFDQMGPGPLGARITKMDIIEGPFVVSAEFKHGAARTPAGVVGIERAGHLALACGILQQTRITEYVAQGEVGVRTVRTPANKVFGLLIAIAELAAFDASL